MIVQKMQDENGVPKGVRRVLEVYGDELRALLAKHTDFVQDSRNSLFYLQCNRLGVMPATAPKHHCELQVPIENYIGAMGNARSRNYRTSRSARRRKG